jgi:multiple sugar transport system permease protein
MPSIALMKIWTDVGFYAVIFLAALQGLPREILDAALVDGANAWQNLWYVKLPLLNPVVVFAVLMGTLWGLNIFTEPLLMTDGGPLGSSLTTLLYLYQVGFIWSRIGFANAMGVTSTLIILALTFVERKLLERTTY